MRARTVAFLVEETQQRATPEQEAAGDLLGDLWLLGVVSGHVETIDPPYRMLDELPGPVAVADAVAWARERADGVLLRDGDEHRYGLGISLREDESDDDGASVEPWLPRFAARFVRRRSARERWKDRTQEDAPIAWEVDALLSPREAIGPDRTVREPRETDAEARATIARWAPERWSDEAVRDFRERHRRSLAEAERTGAGGWFTWGDPRWQLSWTVTAATAALAIAPLRARLQPPPGWEVHFRAEPAEPEQPAV